MSSLPLRSLLTELNIRGCRKLTVEGLRAVSSLPALTELDLSFSNVTDQTLLALRTVRTLTSLDLTECENVTAAGVQALRSTTAAPSLQIEWLPALEEEEGEDWED
mgnify:CR=1 FL=1